MAVKVLHLSYSNAAGVPQAWVRAHRAAGIDAYHVAEVVNALLVGEPPDEVIRWSNNPNNHRLIYPALHAATHIVLHDCPEYIPLVKAAGVPWLYRAFGTPSYKNHELVLSETVGVPRVCDLVEFVRFGFEWSPTPMWVDKFEPLRDTPKYKVFTAAHAPTVRTVKGTAAIIRACERAGVKLSLIEGLPNDKCLRAKAKCHVYIDMLNDEHHPFPDRSCGYAVNGLEAMAMGLPVLGEQSTAVSQSLPDDVLPFVNVTESLLPGALLALRDDSLMYGEYVRRGFDHMRTCHDPASAARSDLEKLGL